MRLLWSEGWKRAAFFFFQVRFQNQYQRLAAHGNCDFGCRYAYAISALFFPHRVRAPIYIYIYTNTLYAVGRLVCLSDGLMAKHCVKRARKDRPLREIYMLLSGLSDRSQSTYAQPLWCSFCLHAALANLIVRDEMLLLLAASLLSHKNHVSDWQSAHQMIHYYFVFHCLIPVKLWFYKRVIYVTKPYLSTNNWIFWSENLNFQCFIIN